MKIEVEEVVNRPCQLCGRRKDVKCITLTPISIDSVLDLVLLLFPKNKRRVFLCSNCLKNLKTKKPKLHQIINKRYKVGGGKRLLLKKP